MSIIPNGSVVNVGTGAGVTSVPGTVSVIRGSGVPVASSVVVPALGATTNTVVGVAGSALPGVGAGTTGGLVGTSLPGPGPKLPPPAGTSLGGGSSVYGQGYGTRTLPPPMPGPFPPPMPSPGPIPKPTIRYLPPRFVRNELPPQYKQVYLPPRVVTSRLPPIGPLPTPPNYPYPLPQPGLGGSIAGGSKIVYGTGSVGAGGKVVYGTGSVGAGGKVVYGTGSLGGNKIVYRTGSTGALPGLSTGSVVVPGGTSVVV